MDLPRHVPLVVATRAEAPESIHHGSIAVASCAGKLLYGVGDGAFPVFARSTLKPFQALPFVLDGGPTRFGFSSEQVALLCASHSGEARQVAAVADMLARIGCSEDDLQCGCHIPGFYAASATSPPPDLKLSPLQNNCSGKHAGFLAWCRLHGQPIVSYLDPHHPLQRTIRATVARLAGLSEGAMAMGIDGCGAPIYALPLARLAGLYARLASDGGATAEDAALATLFSAMTTHPEMVSGEGRTDYLLARAAPGGWVAKGGAEGLQALGIRSRGLGIVIKIGDGSARALRVATADLLARLGLLGEDSTDPVVSWKEETIRNHAGLTTGRMTAVFALERGGDEGPPVTAP